MASGTKKKTTFAKLAREQKLRERRRDKQARKDARKAAASAEPGEMELEEMSGALPSPDPDE